MTDMTPAIPAASKATARKRHTAKRFAAEARFKYAGLACVMIAMGFLVLLLSTVVGNGLPAFTFHQARLTLDLSASEVDPADARSANYRGILNDGLKQALPHVKGRKNVRAARKLISSGAPTILQQRVLADLDLLGSEREIEVPFSDTADLYLKGISGTLEKSTPSGTLVVAGTKGDVEFTSDTAAFAEFLKNARAALAAKAGEMRQRIVDLQRAVDQQKGYREAAQSVLDDEATEAAAKSRARNRLDGAIAALENLASQMADLSSRADAMDARANANNGAEELIRDYPSLFIKTSGGVVKVTSVSENSARGEAIIPLRQDGEMASGNWELQIFQAPESERKISDPEIIWLESLKEAGHVENGWNTLFLTRGASREAEMAGIWGAVVGSFLTLVVTLLLSFPIGVAAAIYLEEFAPKNRITDFIEVNINNLAAVPSIVFGLLGLAVFLNFANFPRSAPLVGGMVLALMTLPTIIIASRAALKAVPPSIREAALGVGASKIQAVFHHVLPLAMPGMLTGTIIGMAQALGETAPLLMIGMVAFIVDVPGGITDPATVLPVQIYMWADFPEQAFQQKTAAAIMVLLAFLVLMNAIAVVLRKRFERRW